MTEALLLVQAAATWALVGLIWTIQVVHYPLFAQVARESYPAWQKSHMSRITVLVGPLMILEALCAVLVLAAAVRAGGPVFQAWIGVGLLVGIWLSTAVVQAPLHGRLAKGFAPDLHRRLVRSNWVRTLLWTARGVLVLAQVRAGGT